MTANLTTSYAAIIKQEKQLDGTLLVYGKATDDAIDSDNQICDSNWLSKAMPEWFKSGGNIREQHSNIAAGVAKELDSKSDGHYISALVVDPTSVKKVETGVLKGFSIGIRGARIQRDDKAIGGRIVDGQIVEVSLVDRPANPNAKLMLAKSDGTEVIQVEELIEQEETVVTEEVVADEIKIEEVVTEEALTEIVETSEEVATDEVTVEVVDGTEKPVTIIEEEIVEVEKSTITPLPTIERVGDVQEEQIFESEDDSNKSALTDSTISAIIEKAVKSAIDVVRSEIELLKSAKEADTEVINKLESELATAKSKAASGGPKRTVLSTSVNNVNEFVNKAAEYRAKSNATTDPILAKGWKEMAQDFESKAQELLTK